MVKQMHKVRDGFSSSVLGRGGFQVLGMRHDAILCYAMMPLSKVSMEVPAALYMEALTASGKAASHNT